MKFVEFSTNTGEVNMQIDEDLLNFAIKNKLHEPIFRLYAWKPACVSLGRNQDESFLDMDFLKSQNIDVVKRLTGGRALLHDNEITYSFICPVNYLKNGEHVISSYKEISKNLINGFNSLRIFLNFGNKKPHTKFDYCMSVSTGADLSYNDKKLIGSAQFRKEGYILQHGPILFDYDKELIEKIFGEKIEDNTITTVKEINADLDIKMVCEVLKNALLQ